MKPPLLALALALAACSERERPDPFGPGTPPQLSADVVAPRTGGSVRANTTILVRVLASERGLRLTGLGFVARRFEAERIDSVLLSFPPRADSLHDFELRLPPNLPLNTQIDITALAASGSITHRSAPQSVIIVR